MNLLTRCIRCDRVLIHTTFICGDCCRVIEERILQAIALLIIPAALVGTWLMRAWRGR